MVIKEHLKKIRVLRYAFHLPKDIAILLGYKLKMYQLKKYPVKKGKDFLLFKDAYHGKRCFIIGLGPSLRVEDLDHLKNEVCFSSNRIFQVYEKTDWRPTFYCSGDPYFSKNIGERLINIVEDSEYAILNMAHLKNYDKRVREKQNVFFYQTIIGTGFNAINKECGKYPDKIDMTGELDSVGTITYEMIEMAIYMGFAEIYLLGVDHNYVGENKNYMKGMKALSEDDKKRMSKTLDTTRWTGGFEHLKNVGEKRGICIRNATRGGELEVFQRVDFDELMYCLEISKRGE